MELLYFRILLYSWIVPLFVVLIASTLILKLSEKILKISASWYTTIKTAIVVSLFFSISPFFSYLIMFSLAEPGIILAIVLNVVLLGGSVALVKYMYDLEWKPAAFLALLCFVMVLALSAVLFLSFL